MDISSVNSDLIRGNVTTIILGCLRDNDKYGYEILKEIEDKSHSQYALKQATLYNQLKRLEKQGLVESYDGAPDDTGGGKRRYYALTPEGRNYLLKEKGEYEYARTILDKLVSDSEFDFTKDLPFDASELRPYSKRDASEEKTKIVYKDKIVEVEKPVEIEKRIYIDRFGNPLTEEEYEHATTQALLDDEEARRTEEELASALAKLREHEDAKSEYEEQLRQAEQEKLEQQEKLRLAEEAQREKDEQLRLAEQARLDYEEKLRRIEEERDSTDEQLRAVEEAKRQNEEQLRLAEEARVKYEEKLRQIEEERDSTDEELRNTEKDRDSLYNELKQVYEEREAEEARKRAEQTQPSTTVDELFSKLEAKSEYKGVYENPTQIYADLPENSPAYFEVTSEPQIQQQSQQTSIQELFRQLDEKAAQIEEDRAKLQEEEEQKRRQEELQRQQEEEELRRQQLEYERELEAAADLAAQQRRQEYVEAEIDGNQSYVDSYGVNSAVVPQNENGFAFERNHVNYKDFFNSITAEPVDDEPDKPQTQTSSYPDTDIKTRLYAKGFKIRPYDKGNTSEYYTFNFIQSNRINRDTFLIVLALFLVEMAVMWISLAKRISYVYFLPITVIGAVLCLIPTVIYFANPTRRIRANFNFKLSILNRTMLFIELTVVCILVGFFALGASVNDIELILCSMVIPAVILLNLPISSIIYYLLYRTKKYHIA